MSSVFPCYFSCFQNITRETVLYRARNIARHGTKPDISSQQEKGHLHSALKENYWQLASYQYCQKYLKGQYKTNLMIFYAAVSISHQIL